VSGMWRRFSGQGFAPGREAASVLKRGGRARPRVPLMASAPYGRAGRWRRLGHAWAVARRCWICSPTWEASRRGAGKGRRRSVPKSLGARLRLAESLPVAPLRGPDEAVGRLGGRRGRWLGRRLRDVISSFPTDPRAGDRMRPERITLAPPGARMPSPRPSYAAISTATARCSPCACTTAGQRPPGSSTRASPPAVGDRVTLRVHGPARCDGCGREPKRELGRFRSCG
jgi:hypothetical protein